MERLPPNPLRSLPPNPLSNLYPNPLRSLYPKPLRSLPPKPLNEEPTPSEPAVEPTPNANPLSRNLHPRSLHPRMSRQLLHTATDASPKWSSEDLQEEGQEVETVLSIASVV
jgi:hypothetical protein